MVAPLRYDWKLRRGRPISYLDSGKVKPVVSAAVIGPVRKAVELPQSSAQRCPSGPREQLRE